MANSITKNYIPQIDYVSRDYTAILADLTAIAKQFNPTWQVTDPSDIGVALLETFAYLGDILSFYTDRMASEGFLGTASQRSSVLQIANMLGYTPTPSSAAIVALSIKNNDTSNPVTIAAGTRVASTTMVTGQSTQVIFETDSAVTIAASGTGSVTATQGETTSGEVLGTSNGAPSQVFKISKTGVIVNSTGSSLSVYVGGVQYTYTSSLVDATPYDSVFTTSMDSDGYTYIVFGDGVAGKIPSVTYTVTATYRIGVGSLGNVVAGSISGPPITGSYNVTVTQPSAASGGADDESTDSIRYNVPRALRTLRRAVSLKDYAYLALQVSGVAKANASSAVWSSVNLYIAPFSSSAVNTYGPFVGSTTSVVSSIAQTAVDGTAGTGYLTYTGTVGAFSQLTANVSYVTITGSSPVAYDIYSPALVTHVATDGSSFTVATSLTTFPTYYPLSSTAMSISAYGSTTAAFNALEANVLSYFTDKVAPNVSLTVSPPTYVPVDLGITLHVLPQYTQATVVAQAQNALSSLVSYNNAFFADRLPPHFVLNALNGIDGVDYATVETLGRAISKQAYSVSTWTRTSGTATFTLTNSQSLSIGQAVVVKGCNTVGATIDGTYTVAGTTSNTVTVVVPSGLGPTGITFTGITPVFTLTGLNSVSGIVVGMNVDGTGLPSNAVVTSVGTTSITIDKVMSTGSSFAARALTFYWTITDPTSYISTTGVDITNNADGTTDYGVVCAANEIPTKGTFTITATGGLS